MKQRLLMLVRRLLTPLRPWLPHWLIRRVFWRRVTFTYTKEDVARWLALAKAWHAVAFLEEIRNDLKKVRQSAARDMASGAFATAITHLVLGANLLQPTELLQNRPQMEATTGADT